jgi:ABC-type multidrug transport system ATPase subunit
MDRIIIMHDGFMIYQGPTSQILPYLGSMGIKSGKFVNPADFIIKTVQAP